MSPFTAAEREYLTADGVRLGRVATVGADGTPHVVPVGFTYNAELDTIEIGGHEIETSKKYRDASRRGRAAMVVDDVVSTDPWRVRGIEIRGSAETLTEPRPRIRIHPERIVSWGIEERGRFARDVARPATTSA